MARVVTATTAPARARVGLPIVPDGSRRHPVLVRLPDDARAHCNNGCPTCLSRPVEVAAAFDDDVRGKFLVLRHAEPTLDPALPERIAALRARGAVHVALLTNARLLAYPGAARRLARAGLHRIIAKMFGETPEAHDAHVRVPGAYEQLVTGIANARKAGLEALLTFPLADSLDPPAVRDRRREIAEALTSAEAVEFPEPEVIAYPGEYRYDVVHLRDAIVDPRWVDTYFPMVHVPTGPACNIRCTYCNVRGGDDQRLFATSHLERIIDLAAAQVLPMYPDRGRPTVDFIGGEPTLHPDLPRLIARARHAGFAQTSICTNGVLLLRRGYLDRLVDAGLTMVRFSFHHHRPEIANALADVGGLGERYVEVAKTLFARTDLHLHIYRILLAHTIDDAPEYMRWLVEHNQTGRPIDLTFGLPSMRGRLFDHREHYPPLDGLREKLAGLVEVAHALGIEPLFHHAPACILPDDPGRVACSVIDTHEVEALSGTSAAENFEGEARHGEACARCALRGRCHGLPSAYWERDAAAAEQWLRPTAAAR